MQQFSKITRVIGCLLIDEKLKDSMESFGEKFKRSVSGNQTWLFAS